MRYVDICKALFGSGGLATLIGIFCCGDWLQQRIEATVFKGVPALVWVACINKFPVYVITTFWLDAGLSKILVNTTAILCHGLQYRFSSPALIARYQYKPPRPKQVPGRLSCILLWFQHNDVTVLDWRSV